jgi:hypothetical protein
MLSPVGVRHIDARGGRPCSAYTLLGEELNSQISTVQKRLITIFFDEPPRTKMGGRQTCRCSMEEGHALLDPFGRHRSHPCAGGSAPREEVLPFAHGCKIN